MTLGTKTFNTIAFLFILLAATLVLSIPFSSCSKEGKYEDDNHCPVVAESAVPQIVKNSFAVRYPFMTVNTWFQKDSIGYCAYFIQPVNQKKLAEFTRDGLFISEKIDIDHDGNFEDSTGTSNPKIPGSCECEIPK
jgi:hypothetical protein